MAVLTETLGFVVSPGGAEGLHASVDFYEITIAGGHRLDGAPTVTNGCFVLNQQEQCARITFGPPIIPGNPTTNIDEVTVPYINASRYTGQVRYTGSGKLDLITPKTAPNDPGYNPLLSGSVTNSDVPSHTTFNLTGS